MEPILNTTADSNSPPAGLPAKAAMPWLPAAQTPIEEWPTNLDLSTKKGKALVMAAGNPGEIDFAGHDSVRVNATHYLIFPDVFTNPETGEQTEGCRLVLFDKAGNTFRSTSVFAALRMKAAVKLYTPEEWAEGIPFVIRRRPNRAGTRTYHDIRVVIEAD